MEFHFDPRMLISGPYRQCPRCGKQEFGVLQIGGASYTRKCRDCSHKETSPLWPLEKKVIYIDQFAISNMMKAIDDTARGHEKTIEDDFWLTLFEALERVCKMQLVICPDSDAHQWESMLSPFFEPLKRMYEQLSHGVSFRSLDSIAQAQVHTAVAAWLKGEAPQYDFNPERATSGRLHDWQGRLLITVSSTWPQDIVDGIRKFRDEVHDKTKEVFEYYRSKGETSFEFWLEHERRAGAKAIVQSGQLYVQRLDEILEGKVDLKHENMYTSAGLDQLRVIIDAFTAHGVAPDERPGRMKEFLESDTFDGIPANRIGTLMWAVIARNSALGQKKPPNRGTSNDIQVVSALVPYCDAMLIDNGCRAIVSSIPKKHWPGYPTKLFSRNNGDEFIAYVKQLETDADPLLLRLVREVYGDDWPKPFLSMYEYERRRQWTEDEERD